MASADFCATSDKRCLHPMRCENYRRVLWLPDRFPSDLNQTPVVDVTAIAQISPDKNVNCRAHNRVIYRAP
jgi:hypothetical protein